ncbi:hypothetical protein J3E68DRAFT_391139 [Trichoderma sp. SZMC 28012]
MFIERLTYGWWQHSAWLVSQLYAASSRETPVLAWLVSGQGRAVRTIELRCACPVLSSGARNVWGSVVSIASTAVPPVCWQVFVMPR